MFINLCLFTISQLFYIYIVASRIYHLILC